MFGNEYSEDQRPITYLKGYPIHAATLIVACYVVTMLATTLLISFGLGEVGARLVFDSTSVLGGAQLWRFLTYGLWNPPSINFVIDMFIIVWFGRELERFFGRRTFLKFYGVLYLLQPVLYTLLGLLQPVRLGGETGAFALFIGFATLYPNVPLFFNILAKWLAVVLVGIDTLMALASHDLTTLITLWAAVGFAFGWVRYEQGRLVLPTLRFPSRKPKFRVVPRAKPEIVKVAPAKSSGSLDALLDKIAKSGMASLTPQERKQLELEREALLRKDERR